MKLRCESSRSAWDPACGEVEERFDRLSKAIEDGAIEHEQVVAKASSLQRMRAYLMPLERIRVVAAAIRKDLEQWGVPDAALQAADKIVSKTEQSDLSVARIALDELFSDEAYWREYDDQWQRELKLVGCVGSLCMLAFLVGSLLFLRNGLVTTGFIFASATGSGMSVLMRRRRLQVYGEVADVWIRALVRFVAGTVAGAVGLGLLSSGFINPLPLLGAENGFVDIVSRCCSDCSTIHSGILFALGLGFGLTEGGLSVLGESMLRRGRQEGPGLTKATSEKQ